METLSQRYNSQNKYTQHNDILILSINNSQHVNTQHNGKEHFNTNQSTKHNENQRKDTQYDYIQLDNIQHNDGCHNASQQNERH
jgi:hypothetical protein